MKYLKTILIITVVTVASLLIYISLNREDWTFDKIQENHTALEQETFLLNESHYAGLREFLPHYFTETQLKQPIPFGKQATVH